jgi:hypothetical protein
MMSVAAGKPGISNAQSPPEHTISQDDRGIELV